MCDLDLLLKMKAFEQKPFKRQGEDSGTMIHVLRVPGGWIISGVFVPEPYREIEGVLELKTIDYSKPFTLEEINSDPRLFKLQHHYDSTIGLWATDVPEKIVNASSEVLKEFLFEIKG